MLIGWHRTHTLQGSEQGGRSRAGRAGKGSWRRELLQGLYKGSIWMDGWMERKTTWSLWNSFSFKILWVESRGSFCCLQGMRPIFKILLSITSLENFYGATTAQSIQLQTNRVNSYKSSLSPTLHLVNTVNRTAMLLLRRVIAPMQTTYLIRIWTLCWTMNSK